MSTFLSSYRALRRLHIGGGAPVKFCRGGFAAGPKRRQRQRDTGWSVQFSKVSYSFQKCSAKNL